jgi:hypothetical protein
LAVSVEDGGFKRNKSQSSGRIDDRRFLDGRLVYAATKEFSPATGQWRDTYRQTMSYFEDGDLRERITEDPVSDDKGKETWGAKNAVLGRVETSETWNSNTGAWN